LVAVAQVVQLQLLASKHQESAVGLMDMLYQLLLMAFQELAT